MTGAFVRVERDGKWRSIEIDELTDDEFNTFRENQGKERGWIWAKFLAGWIRDNIEEEHSNA